MKSDAIKKGIERAPHRSLLHAVGCTSADMAKPFIGREAVRRELETGTFRVLVGLLLEGRMAARAGDPVMKDGVGVGEVTSGLFAPSLNVAVALAYVDQAVSRPGETLAITVRGKSLNARVESLPLYKKGTAREAR